LNIADILRLATKAGTMRLDDDVIKAIKDVRDRASHAKENIVDDYACVKRLATVKRECLRILGEA
jgi:hypothetical protein